MGVKGVVAVLGDSLQAGFNGPSTQPPLFGESGDSRVYVYNRYTYDAGPDNVTETVNVRAGLSDAGFFPGWGPLELLGLKLAEHRSGTVLLHGQRHSALLGARRASRGADGHSGHRCSPEPPGRGGLIVVRRALWGLLERYVSKYWEEALGTPELTSEHVYLGCFASLGNNLNNAGVFLTDESGALASNLNAVLSAVEGAAVASGGGRQIVSRLPLSVIDEAPTVSEQRVETCHEQLASWKQTSGRATARMDGIPWNSNDPHFSDSSAMQLGRKLFSAWRSAQTRAEVFQVADSQTLWTPSELGDSLALWLDGNDRSTVSLDSSDRVTEWRDKSGNGIVATPPTSSARPTFTTAGLAGKHLLTFDGSNDGFQLDSSVALLGTWYLLVRGEAICTLQTTLSTACST